MKSGFGLNYWPFMMHFRLILIPFLFLFLLSCKEVISPLSERLGELEALKGNKEYLASPFFAAGDRIYMVGHQDGSFPDLGWHVEGEMGGIWNHPIKLMDGFTAAVLLENQQYCLDKADVFFNYPIGNKHLFQTSIPGIEVERFQFVPDGKEGLIIDFTFRNLDNASLSFDFEFTGHTDLMPVWLGERANMLDYKDILEFDASRQAWRGKDQGNDWYVLFGSNSKTKAYEKQSSTACNYNPRGKGSSGKLLYSLKLNPGSSQTLRFYVAGSSNDKQALENTFDVLKANAESYLDDKIQHYKNIAEKSKLTIEDKKLEQAFEWVKYNTEWLVREVPELGRGLGAGMPDYPWWFGVDNEYTLKGAIVTGRKDLVYHTIELIHKLSEDNKNGRIVHEVSTNGVVFNPGNINETPQFASLIWWVFQWTGDEDFLSKYYPTVKKGLKWLMEENDEDGNLFPDGYGMMEIHGLESEMIDVATYTQKAFDDAAKMAAIMGEQEQSKAYQNIADRLKQKINEEFWVEAFNSFADFIGTPSEALHLIDAAIVRADTLKKPWAVEELQNTKKRISSYPKDKKQGFVIFHNWVVNTPMEIGIADKEKAIRALEKGSRFVNPFGVFVTGIDRDESAETEEGSFAGSKVFSYTGAVMTLPTGVQAIAENNYGRPDRALDYLQRITRSFGFALPGSIYEVSPDYGMMTQAWNLYSFAVPIVTQFFGIQPQAHLKVVEIRPLLPSTWNNVSLENVLIWDNVLNVAYYQSAEGLIAEFSQEKEDWEIRFHMDNDGYNFLKVNDKDLDLKPDGVISLHFKGKNNRIEIKK